MLLLVLLIVVQMINQNPIRIFLHPEETKPSIESPLIIEGEIQDGTYFFWPINSTSFLDVLNSRIKVLNNRIVQIDSAAFLLSRLAAGETFVDGYPIRQSSPEDDEKLVSLLRNLKYYISNIDFINYSALSNLRKLIRNLEKGFKKSKEELVQFFLAYSKYYIKQKGSLFASYYYFDRLHESSTLGKTIQHSLDSNIKEFKNRINEYFILPQTKEKFQIHYHISWDQNPGVNAMEKGFFEGIKLNKYAISTNNKFFPKELKFWDDNLILSYPSNKKIFFFLGHGKVTDTCVSVKLSNGNTGKIKLEKIYSRLTQKTNWECIVFINCWSDDLEIKPKDYESKYLIKYNSSSGPRTPKMFMFNFLQELRYTSNIPKAFKYAKQATYMFSRDGLKYEIIKAV